MANFFGRYLVEIPDMVGGKGELVVPVGEELILKDDAWHLLRQHAHLLVAFRKSLLCVFPLGNVFGGHHDIFYRAVRAQFRSFLEGKQVQFSLAIIDPFFRTHCFAGSEDFDIAEAGDFGDVGRHDLEQVFIGQILFANAEEGGVCLVHSAIGVIVGQIPDLRLDIVEQDAPLLHLGRASSRT